MRRLILVVLSVLVGFGGVLVLPAAAVGAAEGDDSSAGSDVSVSRYGGADRYETSLHVAEAVAVDAGGSLEWVVLVSGRRWTDAVVAAPVAGALGTPVLMTPPGELRADALAFLQRTGISKALVVGPDASGGAHGSGRGVGAEVLDALREAGITAERVAGDDLYGTGVAAAGRVTPGAMGDLGPTAVIASGEVFADALVAGPFAARGIHPVLLSPPDGLHADVAAYLGEAGIEHVVLMGGTAALSEAVEQSVKDLGIEVSRVAGSTRYDTAVKAAELAEDQYSAAAGMTCFSNDTIGVARARVPFDSFSAAPLLSRLCAPLVLADPGDIPDDTAAYLDAARDQHVAVGLRVFGGDAAVSQAAINAYLTGEESDTSDDEAADEAEDSEAGTAPGVLPAGTCGGAIDDEPSQLVSSINAEDPAWSPDCSQLVYSDGHSLWVANNDGSSSRLLVAHDGGNLHKPTFSPSGALIAYWRAVNRGSHWEAHIWFVNADGTGKKQLTSGDVWDSEPSWSPDETKIAFSRQAGSGRDADGDRVDGDGWIAVIDTDGENLVPLTADGPWEQGPVWSPDGTQIAYFANGAVWVMDGDGTNAMPVVGGAFWGGGQSWSPDGTRIAFARGDNAQSSIVVAEVNGLGEAIVADIGGGSRSPKWSPDGERIAFTHAPDDATRRVYAAGASGKPIITGAQQCRPAGTNGTTAGFPLPDGATPAKGTARVAVLFVDFPDAQAAHTTEEEAALGLPWAEEFLERNSYRKLDVQFTPHHEWLRAPKSYQEYLGESVIGTYGVATNSANKDEFYQDALELIDRDFDFGNFHSFAIVLPSSHFSGGVAGGFIEADGTGLPGNVNNVFPREEPGEAHDWGGIVAHEFAHNLGLLDMYPYDSDRHERPEAPSGEAWVNADFGLMGLDAYFLSAGDDRRRRVEWRFPNGASGGSWHLTSFSPQEMLAWSRWQLSWLNPRQAECITDDTATVTLAPIARTGGAVAMAAVPLNRHEVIVVESRRKIGYDRDETDTDLPTGARVTKPKLIEQGVLVYTVDTLLGSGQLPVKIAGDNGNGQVDDFPVLTLGESVTVRGWTITVTADDGDTHTVRIMRDT